MLRCVAVTSYFGDAKVENIPDVEGQSENGTLLRRKEEEICNDDRPDRNGQQNALPRNDHFLLFLQKRKQHLRIELLNNQLFIFVTHF